MIRTSKLSLKITNKNKQAKLQQFLQEYKDVVQDFIDQLWSNLNESYEVPKFLSTKTYSRFDLSQRAIKCAATQASSIVRSCTEKKRKLIWIINKLKIENCDTTELEIKLAKIKISKPIVPTKFKAELNSIVCDLKQNNKIWFLQLKSIGKKYGKIRLAIKPHRQTLKLKNKGNLLNSFLVSENYIDLRFERKTSFNETGKTLGLDQGITSVFALSDGQISKQDQHGWDLTKILKRLSGKKKGSKGFAKVQRQRKNYVNWSINQINLKGVKQVNLELLKDVRKGKSCSRLMSHWTYTLIKEKVIRYCEEHKVCVKEQCCTYRSQRCSSCGLVRKSNRSGKEYFCSGCGYIGDADMNAALNHEIDLPEVGHLRHLSYNKLGFYWLETGFYNLDGQEFTVLDAKKS